MTNPKLGELATPVLYGVSCSGPPLAQPSGEHLCTLARALREARTIRAVSLQECILEWVRDPARDYC